MIEFIEQHTAWFILIIVLLTAWELVWKAFGLWHSAKNNQSVWFVCILLINTVGILPIVYLKFFKKSSQRQTT